MVIDEYDPDEALRITRVQLMLNGETYTFQVRNSMHKFTLLLVGHTYHDEELHLVISRHASEEQKDPCTAIARDIKTAAWASIEEHRAHYHHLRIHKKK